VEALQVDLATTEGVDKLYAAAKGRQVDALLANAGRAWHGFLDRISEKRGGSSIPMSPARLLSESIKVGKTCVDECWQNPDYCWIDQIDVPVTLVSMTAALFRNPGRGTMAEAAAGIRQQGVAVGLRGRIELVHTFGRREIHLKRFHFRALAPERSRAFSISGSSAAIRRSQPSFAQRFASSIRYRGTHR